MISPRSIAAAALAVRALLPAGSLWAAEPPKLPADATLTQVLGFRTGASLQSPFVFKNNNYLGVGAKLRLLESTPPFGQPGAFCKAVVLGKTGYIRCDKPEAFKFAAAADRKQAQAAPKAKKDAAKSAPKAKGKAGRGQYCKDIESCKAFCKAHCTLDVSKWKASCKFPGGLAGSIDKNSSELKPLPPMKLVTGKGVKATDHVIAGLQRLDEHLATSSAWPKGHVANVKNCYRSDFSDSQNECEFILKGWHIKAKWAGKTPETAAEKKELANADRFINPPKYLGLTWPGATPHSMGIGCDIVVRDEKGKDATTCRMTDNPKQKALSKALVDALTNDKVGAVRLNYEGWHFEWGGTFTSCRCRGDDCNTKHWPTPCDGPHHCARPK